MPEREGKGESSEAEAQPLKIPVAGSSRPVFLSYASPDADVAQKVCAALEAGGFPCWIAPRDVVPGTLYAEGIVRALDESKVLVLVLSKDAVASAHVGKELERATSKRHPIIALKVDNAPLTPAFEYFLNESQWIEAGAGGTNGAIAKLVEAVGRHLSSGTASGSIRAAQAPVRKAATSRRVWGIAAAGIVLALVALYFLSEKGWLHGQGRAQAPPAAAITDKSIAVLPFVDMSEKKDQEYFGDGMAEEIINMLAQVPNLHVPARTSSFFFKGKSMKISDIARELGVADVLEGSIRRSGNQIRVTAQLVRADNGYHLWSKTYDRPLDDLFKVQDEIANSVVQALRITLMGGPLTRQKGGTQNLDAYQLFLRGLSSMWQNTVPSLTAAREDFEKAIKLDPDFGLGWAELSRDTLFLTNNGVFSPQEGYERARQQAEHALQLSPNLAEAHAMLSNVHRNFDWDWSAAEAEVRLALAADPTNPTALMRAGQLAYTLGRWDDAERQLQSALVRDPFLTVALWSLGTAQYGAGRFADADATYRRLLKIAPDYFNGRSFLGKTLLAEGKPDGGLAMLQLANDNARQVFLPIVLQAAGRQAESDEALTSLIAKFADTQAYYVAMTYAYRGDRNLAFRWLDRAYEQKDQGFIAFVGEPLFRNVKSDPRYKAFLKKMNLPE
jgi:TolB-like protein/Tfp pilus assembly protein PilF